MTTPTLVSAFGDGSGRAVLTFSWPPFTDTLGTAVDHYVAGLYADAGLTATVTGGAAQTVAQAASPTATFSPVPAGLPFLLSVAAVSAGGATVATASLLGTSTFAAPPSAGDPAAVPAAGSDAGLLAPLRPVYGTAAGVRRWARAVSFGDAPSQASDLDILYFLMVASDDADGLLCPRYAVPLTKYRDDSAQGGWRYPPPIPGLVERKAAGLLLYARKAALTEAEGGTAVGLMSYADRALERIADGWSLIGQTAAHSMLPQVYNPVPRQFSMPGDPLGLELSPVVGSTDVRFLRPHALPFLSVGWRFGAAGGNDFDYGA